MAVTLSGQDLPIICESLLIHTQRNLGQPAHEAASPATARWPDWKQTVGLQLPSDRHTLEREVGACCQGDGVAGEVALHRPVVERVVQCRHDHRLVEY